MGLKTGALDRDHQNQIGLLFSIVFEKIELFFITFKLELCIDHLLVPNSGVAVGGGGHLFFGNAKKGPH